MVIKTIDLSDFIETGCQLILEHAKKNIESKGSFSLVLSGGRTPKLFFDILINEYKKKIEWSKVDFFWLDERCVTPNHKESNYKLAFEALISKLDKTGDVYRMEGELEPKIAAIRYQEKIKLYFKKKSVSNFDFILLGMGEDGHVASIFPESEDAQINKNDMVFATSQKHMGFYRISFNYNLIESAEFKLLLVNTKEKLEILKNEAIIFPINQISRKTILSV